MRKGGVILAASLLLSACGDYQSLPMQAPADLIKVNTLAGFPKLPLKEIREKEKIDALVSFVNALPNKWKLPWYGPPIGRVYFEFIKANKSAGNFYVGLYFVGRDSGKSYSQTVDRQTIEDLGKIVGIDLWPYVSANVAIPSPAPSAAPSPVPKPAVVAPTLQPTHHP